MAICIPITQFMKESITNWYLMPFPVMKSYSLSNWKKIAMFSLLAEQFHLDMSSQCPYSKNKNYFYEYFLMPS